MDFIAISVVLLGSGVLLKVVGRSLEHRNAVKEVVLMKNNDPEGFDQRLKAFRNEHQLPALPTDSVQYDGWWEEVIKRIQIKSVSQTLAERQKLQDQVITLHEQHLRYLKVRGEIGRQSRRDAAADDAVDAERAEFQRRAADARASMNPPVPSEVDRINAETARVNAQIALEQSKRKLHEVSNPPKSEPQPKRESWPEKVAREFQEEQEARLRLISLAEELAKRFPEQRERIMRDTQKKIEALKERT